MYIELSTVTSVQHTNHDCVEKCLQLKLLQLEIILIVRFSQILLGLISAA